jgi:hypothetical protein
MKVWRHDGAEIAVDEAVHVVSWLNTRWCGSRTAIQAGTVRRMISAKMPTMSMLKANKQNTSNRYSLVAYNHRRQPAGAPCGARGRGHARGQSKVFVYSHLRVCRILHSWFPLASVLTSGDAE